MNIQIILRTCLLPALLVLLPLQPAAAAILVQCPGDNNQDAQWSDGEVRPDNTSCMHLGAGDGFIKMGDGYLQYMFGFANLTGIEPHMAMMEGMLAAQFAAPLIRMKEGEHFYLTLSNVGMVQRADLFDPHTVHFHGYPNAAPVFDGEPMSSLSINMGSSLTYFYQAPDPGTYMYHCHVEATEHMQMGMLGNLYVTPLQDGTSILYNGRTYTKFAYNDIDGSTGYDVDFPIQIHAFDPEFHDASLNVQPLPFANMRDTYPMLNGRGYPDTINPLSLVPPDETKGKISQPVNSLITAAQGQRILLRISSLSTVDYYTLSVLGIPMQVVGRDAKILRSPSGANLYYTTNSVTLGGGEAVDVILDTALAPAGTYFLYTTNLNHLSNNTEDFGGMMTEIRIQ